VDPTLGIALLFLFFAGSHIGLATSRVRGSLVARLGVWGFTLLFSLVAAISFSLLVHYLAVHRFEGGPGLALGQATLAHWIGMAAIAGGCALIAGGLAAYEDSPMTLLGRVGPPRGLARVTRHPFAVGVALFAFAHAALATHRVGAVAFAGLALFAIVGSLHQDRKLAARLGPAYERYLSETSTLPFLAIARGRQRLVWRELPWPALALGVASAFALRAVHDSIFAHGGAWVMAGVLAPAAFFLVRDWRRSRRAAPTHAPIERARV
jgi:uncharacterized membrane protein